MSSLNSLPILKPKKVEKSEQPKSDKELERLRKIRERIIRNRASANASRQKKKEYIESLEKKNKELIQHKEKIDNENKKLKDENENLKLQIQYLNQVLNKMISNGNGQNSVQIPNILNNNNNNNVYSSPINEINFTSGINSINQLNSPESLSSSSPLFNDIQSIPSPSNTLINVPNSNVNMFDNNMNVLSLQSSVGEPAALTNENSLQRTLFCRRMIQEILKSIILTKFLTNFLMVTITSIIRISAYRPLNNNNNYKNLYQRSNYIKIVPISIQNSQLDIKFQEMNYHKDNYSKYWNNKYIYWKDKMS